MTSWADRLRNPPPGIIAVFGLPFSATWWRASLPRAARGSQSTRLPILGAPPAPPSWHRPHLALTTASPVSAIALRERQAIPMSTARDDFIAFLLEMPIASLLHCLVADQRSPSVRPARQLPSRRSARCCLAGDRRRRASRRPPACPS